MYVLISHLFKGKDIQIVSVHDGYMQAYERWVCEDNPHSKPRRWHAIRQPGDQDGLVEKAIDVLKLTERQARMLVAMLSAKRDSKGRRGSKSKAIYEADARLSGKYDLDVAVVYHQLLKKHLVGADGEKYGAKRYYFTGRGRAIAMVLREVGTMPIERMQARLNLVYGREKAPKVTEVSPNGSYKIEGSDIWRVFPGIPKPMRAA